MKFLFKAKNQAGQIKEGVVEALDRNAAIQILQQNALLPMTIQEEEKKNLLLVKNLTKIWEGVKQKELMVFFQQLATLIEARVPIVSSLKTISDQCSNKYLRLIIIEVADDIEDGMPFSEALEKHPDVFSSLTVNMVKAGEVSGTLQKSVAFVAANIEKNYQQRRKNIWMLL